MINIAFIQSVKFKVLRKNGEEEITRRHCSLLRNPARSLSMRG
jgi:hypothetical protein